MFTKDKDLSPLTTFAVAAKARLFAEYSSEKELLAISRTPEFIENEVLHIGGGSNLLFASDFDGLVLHSAIKGIVRYDKDAGTAFAIAGAGVKWTEFVDWCIASDLAGAENLAGIPGEVGAAPVQNIGAYGTEAKDIIHNVECFDTVSRKTVVFSNAECGFAYRDSRFKHEWKGRYYVLRVSFRLKPGRKAENLSYGPLRQLAERLGHSPDIAETASEIIRIRNSKLPDPSVAGNAGSFFKNPVVSRYFYEEQMKGLCPDIPCYAVNANWVKLSAGWLIERSGMKGRSVGNAVVYPRNCLVIANQGGASAKDILDLADEVTEAVLAKFAVVLEKEVNVIDTSMDVTILGSGTSKGVPEVACLCRVCRSSSALDKRLRASALVETRGMKLLIDASPDFRMQAITNGILSLDAVLVTHQHYDHVGGLDDLRPFCAHKDVPIYLQKDVNDDLHRRLDYCFRNTLYPGVPSLEMHEVDFRTPFFINGLKIIPIRVMHGSLPILGYRIGKFAYITDAKTIPEDEMEKLVGLDVLVINALRERPHFAHMNFDEAVAVIEALKPKTAYLTHFNHEAGLNGEIEERLPGNVHPCHDGLHIHLD